jgi:RNA polymerase sigma-70 factor (ECF subfamily)
MQLRNRKEMFRVDISEGRGWDGIAEQHSLHESSEAASRESELKLLEHAISQLSEDQRICIEMFYLKKYCYQDVAEIGGYTMNEVKSHIQNGKRNLKLFMMKHRHETADN